MHAVAKEMHSTKRKLHSDDAECYPCTRSRRILQNTSSPPLKLLKSTINSESQDANANNAPQKEFSVAKSTCLFQTDSIIDVCGSPSSSNHLLLRRALSIQQLDDKSWLTSSLINLVLAKFAKEYKNAHFMSIDFALLLNGGYEGITDILGKELVPVRDRNLPIVVVFNSQNIHWNMLRVIRKPYPELQLFEPMGKPHSRHRGLSYRSVPRSIIDWLNSQYPLPSQESWINRGISAITSPQQINSFDCGVACLLYAEKCGLGQDRERINKDTSQEDISEYRRVLQDFTRQESEYQ